MGNPVNACAILSGCKATNAFLEDSLAAGTSAPASPDAGPIPMDDGKAGSQDASQPWLRPDRVQAVHALPELAPDASFFIERGSPARAAESVCRIRQA